jgi:hypothetical protein
MVKGNGHSQMRKPVLCVAENRLSCETGVRLLIASAARHSPHFDVQLFFPVATDEFKAWLLNFPNVSLNHYEIQGPWSGWNIKPEIFRTLFANGFENLLWVDTDIIITRDIGELYEDVSEDMVIIAEEALCSSHFDGDALRARSWGLPVGRKMPFQVNTGVLGLSLRHSRLLERWAATLRSPDYLAAMAMPWHARPRHFMGDQEVLNALLCSTEFSDVTLKYLTRGREIIQYFGSAGYTLSERFTNLIRGQPIFIHSLGHKAWMPMKPARGVKDRVLQAYQEVSPYTFAARRYVIHLPENHWMTPKSMAGRLLTWAAFGRGALAGFPIAAINDVFRWIKWAHTAGEPRR